MIYNFAGYSGCVKFWKEPELRYPLSTPPPPAVSQLHQNGEEVSRRISQWSEGKRTQDSRELQFGCGAGYYEEWRLHPCNIRPQKGRRTRWILGIQTSDNLNNCQKSYYYCSTLIYFRVVIYNSWIIILLRKRGELMHLYVYLAIIYRFMCTQL